VVKGTESIVVSACPRPLKRNWRSLPTFNRDAHYTDHSNPNPASVQSESERRREPFYDSLKLTLQHTEDGKYSLDNFDIVTDRNNLRKLHAFVTGDQHSYPEVFERKKERKKEMEKHMKMTFHFFHCFSFKFVCVAMVMLWY
jgi:hypothetical protein